MSDLRHIASHRIERGALLICSVNLAHLEFPLCRPFPGNTGIDLVIEGCLPASVASESVSIIDCSS
jgi:hypothetical protein